MDKVKPGIKKMFIGMTAMYFIFGIWTVFSGGVSLDNMMFHNTLVFIIIMGFLYHIYVRQEFIYGELQKKREKNNEI